MKPTAFYVAAASLALMAAPASAFEVTGGELELTYSAFEEDSDFSRTSLEGSLEAAFSRSVAAQVDLGGYKFNFVDDEATNATVHAIYHANDAASFGIFYGQDSLDGESTDFYGLEAGHEFEGVDIEAYVATGEEADVDGTVIGINGVIALNDRFDIGASYDTADFDGDVSLNRFAVTGTAHVTDNMGVFAEVGSLEGEVAGLSDSELFFGVGAEVTFGAKRGSTFGQRGLAHLVPGL